MKKSSKQKTDELWLSTGSTLLNLNLTGHHAKGFAAGDYIFLVGDSQSGKTFLSLTCFAEACANKAFKDYALVFDNVEGGARMDFAHYFGPDVEKRLVEVSSQTIEEFYLHNVQKALDDGPCIYVLDSMDALTSEYELKKFDEKRQRGDQAAGDMGDGKAKMNSRHMRVVQNRVRETRSILIVINQTRDNVGGGIFDSRTTRSGGRSLKFYSQVELWSSVGSRLKPKTVRNVKYDLGINCRIKITKNRYQGRTRAFEIPILQEIGIDDVGACVDYLVQNNEWPKASNGIIDAKDLGLKAKRTSLIKQIEESDKIWMVREVVSDVFHDIEESLKSGRKPRYS